MSDAGGAEAPPDRGGAVRLTARCRPLVLGASIGHPIGSGGSIGPFVQLSDGKVGLLSFAFVLAPKGAKIGDIIHQPSPLDQTVLTAQTRIAMLTQIIAAKAGQPNQVDVATAALLDGVEPLGNILPLGCPDSGRPITGLVEPTQVSPGDFVAFVGRTSGFSMGQITGVATSITLQGGSGIFLFENTIEVRSDKGPFSRPGDGGALVYRCSDFAAIGLVFASASGGEQQPTYLLLLEPALRAVGATLLITESRSKGAIPANA